MNQENTINSFHSALLLAKQLVYDICGFRIDKPSISQSNGACSFELNGLKIQHRLAKITPTKTGQFVSIWKRDNDGLTVPYHISDEIDILLISCLSGKQMGQFVFSKSILIEKQIISENNSEGKRGIRVYPPWDKTENKQAKKTQIWQSGYFLDIQKDTSIDLHLARKLFSH